VEPVFVMKSSLSSMMAVSEKHRRIGSMPSCYRVGTQAATPARKEPQMVNLEHDNPAVTQTWSGNLLCAFKHQSVLATRKPITLDPLLVMCQLRLAERKSDGGWPKPPSRETGW
jgi:hypothetical protein